MTLINYIREYQLEGSEPRDAVDQAVQRCIAENILSVFLTKHRAEVMYVCIIKGAWDSMRFFLEVIMLKETFRQARKCYGAMIKFY